jgi:hypothetical protein
LCVNKSQFVPVIFEPPCTIQLDLISIKGSPLPIMNLLRTEISLYHGSFDYEVLCENGCRINTPAEPRLLEFRWGHGYWSFALLQVKASATGWSLVQGNPIKCVYLTVWSSATINLCTYNEICRRVATKETSYVLFNVVRTKVTPLKVHTARRAINPLFAALDEVGTRHCVPKFFCNLCDVNRKEVSCCGEEYNPLNSTCKVCFASLYILQVSAFSTQVRRFMNLPNRLKTYVISMSGPPKILSTFLKFS